MLSLEEATELERHVVFTGDIVNSVEGTVRLPANKAAIEWKLARKSTAAVEMKALLVITCMDARPKEGG